MKTNEKKQYPKLEGKLTASIMKNLIGEIKFVNYDRSDDGTIVTLNFEVSSFASNGVSKIIKICRELNITLTWFHVIGNSLILTFYFDRILNNGQTLFYNH